MAEELNLFQKLLEIQKTVSYLKKEAQGQQYNYVSSSQTLGQVKQAMDEQGVLLTMKVTNKELHLQEMVTKAGNKTTNFITELSLIMTWINVDDPSDQYSLPWYAQGVDLAGEKGVGKALTYAEKYFILKQFHIATDKDDPDTYQEKVESSKVEPKSMYKDVFSVHLKQIAELTDSEFSKLGQALITNSKVRWQEPITETQKEQVDKVLNAWLISAQKKHDEEVAKQKAIEEASKKADEESAKKQTEKEMVTDPFADMGFDSNF